MRRQSIIDLTELGFFIARDVVPEPVLSALEEAVARAQQSPGGRRRRGELFGMRNLLAVPEVRHLAGCEPFRDLVVPVLGAGAMAVRGLFFDKTPAANWRLGWHQDRAIAVKQRVEVDGYGPWSTKAGVCHVYPPLEILADMVTVRLHLDDCDATNGALKVIPGTHARPELAKAEINELATAQGFEVCAGVA